MYTKYCKNYKFEGMRIKVYFIIMDNGAYLDFFVNDFLHQSVHNNNPAALLSNLSALESMFLKSLSDESELDAELIKTVFKNNCIDED